MFLCIFCILKLTFFTFSTSSHVKGRLAEASQHSRLSDAASKVLTATEELLTVVQKQPALVEAGARDFAFSLSNLFIGAVFLQNAALSADRLPIYRHSELLALR